MSADTTSRHCGLPSPRSQLCLPRSRRSGSGRLAPAAGVVKVSVSSRLPWLQVEPSKAETVNSEPATSDPSETRVARVTSLQRVRPVPLLKSSFVGPTCSRPVAQLQVHFGLGDVLHPQVRSGVGDGHPASQVQGVSSVPCAAAAVLRNVSNGPATVCGRVGLVWGKCLGTSSTPLPDAGWSTMK